jgi:hypothetical protein
MFNVQVRETGRDMRVIIEPSDRPHVQANVKALIGDDDTWRLIQAMELREDKPNRA